MALVRIRHVQVLQGCCLRLTLTDGRVVERDVAPLLVGPVFEPLLRDASLFAQAREQDGTVVWPNGADLCPDVLIWGGLPPEDRPALTLPVSPGPATAS